MTVTATMGPERLDYEAKRHIYWAVRTEPTLQMRRLLSVTEVLADNRLIDTQWFTEAARRRGTFVHLACHLLDSGDLDWDTLDERLPGSSGYVRSWDALKRDTGLTVLASELRVWNAALGVAGTLDRIVLIRGREWLLDLKTVGQGAGLPPPCTAYQTAAYDYLAPGKSGRRRGAIVLQADGSLPKLVTYNNDLDDWDTFLTLLEATRTRRKHV